MSLASTRGRGNEHRAVIVLSPLRRSWYVCREHFFFQLLNDESELRRGVRFCHVARNLPRLLAAAEIDGQPSVTGQLALNRDHDVVWPRYDDRCLVSLRMRQCGEKLRASLR